MTPKFAQAVDPIFIEVLDLLDRISRDKSPSPQEARLRIVAMFDQAQAMVGARPDWTLARYALAAWIDEMLVDAPWDGREWWSNNVLEVELFSTRLCYEQFFVQASQATMLDRRDALEVFYVCVVLGFRGMYRDTSISAPLLQSHGLPPELETWLKQAAMTIRLGQGRPALSSRLREIRGASPLRRRAMMVWSWLAAVMLTACNLVVYMLYWRHS